MYGNSEALIQDSLANCGVLAALLSESMSSLSTVEQHVTVSLRLTLREMTPAYHLVIPREHSGHLLSLQSVFLAHVRKKGIRSRERLGWLCNAHNAQAPPRVDLPEVS